jgi:hypothetical protein
MNLWKRFTAWLHCLRHPVTIITMDEAPVKGVQFNLTYPGEYSVIAKQVQESLERAKNTVGHTVEFWAPIEGEMPDPNILADMLKEGDEDNNVLPVLQKRAEERKKGREATLKHVMDWSANADLLTDMTKRAERVNMMLGALLERSEDNRKLENSMKGPDGLCTDCGGTHDYWHAEKPEEWSYKEGCLCHKCQAYPLDHVEECLDILRTSIMVGLHPQEAANEPAGLQSQMKVVGSVKEDFKKLSEAIKALREE